ncbi:MAG: dephospho-CoA kinase [Marinilabiliaceae bacterium]|jgi:dephospho-CoA kinase|nr:dephospho-CoA kinase [Marinilabiliaceae bacterium]
MKFRLGITGGIGSGKSTVCKVFEVLGVRVFYSDLEARVIMDTSPLVYKGLEKILGFDIYVDGKIDRPRLADIIFNDSKKLEQVNMLVHPLVLEKFAGWSQKQDSDYVILESAVLFESGAGEVLDKTLAVIAPLEERIARVMERNNMKREEVLERIKNQVSENEMLRKADFLLDNADSSMLIPQVISVHNEIKNILTKSENG